MNMALKVERTVERVAEHDDGPRPNRSLSQPTSEAAATQVMLNKA
jgi:hypothetical protein